MVKNTSNNCNIFKQNLLRPTKPFNIDKATHIQSRYDVNIKTACVQLMNELKILWTWNIRMIS